MQHKRKIRDVATPPAGGDKPLREVLAEIRADYKKTVFWLKRKGK